MVLYWVLITFRPTDNVVGGIRKTSVSQTGAKLTSALEDGSGKYVYNT